MDRTELQRILRFLPEARVVVLGDFFLDRYFVIESDLAEVSVETGLTAHQVVDRRLTPGAAGTVVSNLCALGVGDVICIGAIGADGEGFELRKALRKTKANYVTWLVESKDWHTPCYTKPMLRKNGQETELERLDIKNRTPLSEKLESQILERLRALLPEIHAVVIADQVQERNCGVVTDRMRDELAKLAAEHPGKFFLADSRVRIGEFRGVMIKPNMAEAVDAVRGGARADKAGTCTEAVTPEDAADCARELCRLTGKPVFMTAQEDGLFVFDDGMSHVPAIEVEGEIDPVGAGDSCIAGIVSALCAGASLTDAALLGNIVASITVQKIGQTGTASPEEVMARFDEAGL